MISSESVLTILKAMQLRIAHDEVVELIGQTGNDNPDEVALPEFLAIISM